MVLGTMGYMSPEQVRGEPADHRSDLFSLGAVLYEMLAGQRAFTGPSLADSMSAILKEDPAPLPSDLETVPRVCRSSGMGHPRERLHRPDPQPPG